MPIYTDVPLVKFEDGALNLTLASPQSISGWVVELYCTKRFGSDDRLWQRSAASGFTNGESGCTFTNVAQGTMRFNIREADTSGLPFGNYALKCERLMSGCRTPLTEGYLIVSP